MGHTYENSQNIHNHGTLWHRTVDKVCLHLLSDEKWSRGHGKSVLTTNVKEDPHLISHIMKIVCLRQKNVLCILNGARGDTSTK